MNLIMDDKILTILKNNNERYTSGEELSQILKISRSAIWKHIENLRQEGYSILALPHLGYKLAALPDKLSSVELSYKLNTKIIGRRIYSYNQTSSTNDLAYRLAEDKLNEGACVFAESQDKGRGRLARKWESPKGVGIYFSVILRPKIAPQQAAQVTLMASLAVATAIRKITSLEAFIKWPNDILINGKKVCGILTEMSAEMDTVKFLILGIGLNVNTSKEALPKGAGSLKEELGEKVSRLEMAQAVLGKLDFYYQIFKEKGFAAIRGDWRELTHMLGSRVKVSCQSKKIEGLIQDIDKEGALVVRLDNGFQEKVLSGDVVLVR